MPIDLSPQKWKEALKLVEKHPNLFTPNTAGIIVRRNHWNVTTPPVDISKMDKPTRERYILETYRMF